MDSSQRCHRAANMLVPHASQHHEHHELFITRITHFYQHVCARMCVHEYMKRQTKPLNGFCNKAKVRRTQRAFLNQLTVYIYIK